MESLQADYQAMTCGSLDRANATASVAEARIATRRWIKENITPYLRARGGLVQIANLCKHLHMDQTQVSSMLNQMPNTIYRYETYDGVIYVGMFDRKLNDKERRTMYRIGKR